MNISIINDVSSNECINMVYNDIYSGVVQFKSLNNIEIICDNDINDYILLLKETPYTTKYIDETNELILSFIFTYNGLKKSIQFIHEYILYNNISISNNQLFEKIQLIEKMNINYQQQINDLVQCNTSLLTKINTLEQDIMQLKQHVQNKQIEKYENCAYIKINNDEIYIKSIIHFATNILKNIGQPISNKSDITSYILQYMKEKYINNINPQWNLIDIAHGDYKAIECFYYFNDTYHKQIYKHPECAYIGTYKLGIIS